jgi:hypothetical protein
VLTVSGVRWETIEADDWYACPTLAQSVSDYMVSDEFFPRVWPGEALWLDTEQVRTPLMFVPCPTPTLALTAALVVTPPYDDPIGPEDPADPEASVLADCEFTVGIREARYMAQGMICGKTVDAWLSDTNPLHPRREGAARSRVGASIPEGGMRSAPYPRDPQKTAREILEARYDDTCGRIEIN